MIAPPYFSLSLEEGVGGGLGSSVPPSATYTIAGKLFQPTWAVTITKRVDGTSTTGDPECKVLPAHDIDVLKLAGELYDILRKLPTEKPPGIEDIYRLSTNIHFSCGGWHWRNEARAGCDVHDSPVPQPTPEEKDMFKRAVDIVLLLVTRATASDVDS